MSEIDVSIIIPVYNAASFLRECFDSILVQNYLSYEVVIINDGSTDDSPTIINEYCLTDTRFVCITQENKGVACARNTGLDAANGKYILFLDADDALHENTLSDLLPIAFSNDIDFIRMNRKWNPKYQDIQKDTIIKRTEFLSYLINDIEPMMLPMSIIKTTIINKNHIRFKTEFCEDILFNIHAFFYCNNIFFTQKEYYIYRRTVGGATSSYFNRKKLVLERNKTMIELLKLTNSLSDDLLPFQHKKALHRTVIKYAGARLEYFLRLLSADGVKETFSPDSKIVFWGVSRIEAFKVLKNSQVSDIVFTDCNSDWHGRKMLGHPIVSPVCLIDSKYAGYKNRILVQGSLIKFYAQMHELGLVKSFMDLRLNVGENEQYDMQLEAMDKLFHEMMQIGVDLNYEEVCNKSIKTVILFGTGKIASEYYANLDDEFDILCFADNDAEKQGKKLLGTNILNPKVLSDIDADVIIAVGKEFRVEIIKQLFDMGIRKFYLSSNSEASNIALFDFSAYDIFGETLIEVC